MLTVHQISKSFGIETILEKVSFSLNPGERIGLIGPNGCGKTTLLRILAGLDRPDEGGLHLDPPDLRIGFLPQGLEPDSEDTIERFLARLEGDLTELTNRLEQLAYALTHTPERAGLQREYDDVLARIAIVSENARRGPAVLGALGLGDFSVDTPVEYLSGGQKTRLALAGVLLSNPQLLLLDEPTNHLDIAMLEWLEDWLVEFSGGALIVSHDRAFLDQTVTGILELDPLIHTIRPYTGNYTAYLEQKLAEREKHWQAYNDQLEEIERLRAAAAKVRGIAKFRRGGKGDSGDKFAKGFFANRTKGTIGRAKNLEKRLERLLTDEKIEKPRQSWQMKLEFNDTPSSGRDVVRLENLTVGYGEHILLQNLNRQVRHGARIALIGPNGTGKTTLLRTIAGVLPPLDGKVVLGANLQIGYMDQEQENLNPELDAFTTVRNMAPFSETEARSFLHLFLFSGDDVFLPVKNLSYGERSRLLLACLVARGCNLLLLDEPINHLDIPSRARFEQALSNFEGTILAVVHDRYFIDGFATEIWEVVDKGLDIIVSSNIA